MIQLGIYKRKRCKPLGTMQFLRYGLHLLFDSLLIFKLGRKVHSKHYSNMLLLSALSASPCAKGSK